MAAEAQILLIFVPLLTACVLPLLSGGLRKALVIATIAVPPVWLLALTGVVLSDEVFSQDLSGFAPPLGIRLVTDRLSLLLLWLVALVGGLAAIAAYAEFPPASTDGKRFWPLWMILIAAMNALLLSADLFNLYVALELVTLSAVPLIAMAGGLALRAAMRYLLMGLLASLAYLLGIALLYSAHGTLDLYLLADRVGAEASSRIALALMTAGLLLKTAVFPLHVWLPPAHGSAPGAVSAVLSAIVIKLSLYLIYRLWFWTGGDLDMEAARLALGVLGAAAILYGSLAALVQPRLKLVVAYSTVAQIGYLLLIFPLAGVLAWHGVLYQLISHAFAKSAMFLAAANVMIALRGDDRLERIAGADVRLPMSLFAFGLAGVSIMGLPPSGGFIAKWMLLEAAWRQAGWGWMLVIVIGSLLAASYVFRVLAAAFRNPSAEPPSREVASKTVGATALTLALLSIAAGFVSAPLLSLAGDGPFDPDAP